MAGRRETPAEAAPPHEREVQEALLLGEALQNDLRALDEQRAYFESLLRDLDRGRTTLEGLSAAEAGQETLLPVGGGHFVRANLHDKDRVLASLGAGVVIETPVADALSRLGERINSAEQALERTTQELRRIEGELSRLNARLSQLAPER